MTTLVPCTINGSLYIEKLVISNHKVDTVSYQDYTRAESLDKDGKITTLSAINNMYRTFVSVAVCLFFTVIADIIWRQIPQSCSECIKTFIVMVFCVVLGSIFAKSYNKQIGYVVNRVKIVLKDKKVVNKDNVEE